MAAPGIVNGFTVFVASIALGQTIDFALLIDGGPAVTIPTIATTPGAYSAPPFVFPFITENVIGLRVISNAAGIPFTATASFAP